MSFENMTVLVTGSSRGLGNKIALSLADEGADIVIHYLRSKAEALQTVDRINKQGGRAIAVQADVRDWIQVQKMFDSIMNQMGRIDGLVNNVGDFLQKPLSEMSISEWHHLMDSNLNSTFYCCKAVLPYMREKCYGRIINIAVANADHLHAFQTAAAYGIAKTGVLVLTRCLALAESDKGITVNCVSPGLMDNGSLSTDNITQQSGKIPMQRVGQAQDVFAAIRFLLSPEAGYVTGTNIHVSGGWGI